MPLCLLRCSRSTVDAVGQSHKTPSGRERKENPDGGWDPRRPNPAQTHAVQTRLIQAALLTTGPPGRHVVVGSLLAVFPDLQFRGRG